MPGRVFIVTQQKQVEPTWVLLHGWGSDSGLWREFSQYLPKPIQLLDLPGFAGREHTHSWQVFVEQTAAQLPNHCILLGWSLGGMLASQIAAAAPDKVDALITIASNPCFVANEQWPHAMSAEVYDQFCAGFGAQPEKTWKRFCSLQAQGDSKSKHILKLLKEQTAPSPAVYSLWTESLQWLR